MTKFVIKSICRLNIHIIGTIVQCAYRTTEQHKHVGCALRFLECQKKYQRTVKHRPNFGDIDIRYVDIGTVFN